MTRLPTAWVFVGFTALMAGPALAHASSIELPGPGDDAYGPAASLPAPRRQKPPPIVIRPEELAAVVDHDWSEWDPSQIAKPLEVGPKIPVEALDPR